MPKGHHNNHRRGPDSHLWSERELRSSHGYSKVRVGKGHPLSDPNGYAYEHLLVWVSAGNNRPTANEVIHHINGVKTDNRISNLELRDRAQHSTSHGGGISNKSVFEIRTLYASGQCDMPTLAAKYGIPTSRVSKMIRGETRLSAGGPTRRNNRGNNDSGRLLDGREWNEVPNA